MFSRNDWWKDFFSGAVVDFWRRVVPPETTRTEADFLERMLSPPARAQLLDVPCGDGRLSLELARRGYRMTGVDISSDFLEFAREDSRRDGLEIEWCLSEMRDLPWEARFDGAFCAGSSFGFLGDDGDAAFLAAVARSLKPDAGFVIDAVKAAEVILPQFRAEYQMELGNIHFAAANSYDPVSGWMDSRYTIMRAGREEIRQAAHRIYTYRDVAPNVGRRRLRAHSRRLVFRR